MPDRHARCWHPRAAHLRIAAVALVAAGIVAAHAGPCGAHAVGVSRGAYRSDGESLASELALARGELLAALPELDADRDGALTSEELRDARAALDEWIGRGLDVRGDAGPCGGSLQGAEAIEGDGVALRALHRCAPGSHPQTVRLALLSELSLGHRHLAEATTAGAGTAGARTVLYAGRPELALPRGGAPAEPETSASLTTLARSLLALGVEHILTGTDHLLFLLALIVAGAPLQSVLGVVTAFTVAHSLTLALAALDLWAPSPALVEPAIALSIAYVGLENLLRRDATHRWRLTFAFGLVHGFGFAGALRDIALPAAQLPIALASFNVGVEAGQLAILALALPAITWLRRRTWFHPTALAATNAAITAAGIWWLAVRIQPPP